MKVPILPEVGPIADAISMVEEISLMRDRPLLTILTGQHEISEALLEEIYIRVPFRRFGELDVLLDAPGGDAHAAFGTIELLQRQARQVVVLVPRRAASAASILAMGATMVELGPIGALGPVDPQVGLDLRWGRSGSSLTELAVGKELARTAEAMARLLDEVDLASSSADQLFEEFATTIASSIAGQVSLADQARCEQLIEATEHLVVRVLRHSGRTGDRAQAIARTMVRSFTDHQHRIGLTEAKAIDLPVMGMDEPVAFFGYMAASTCDELDAPLVRLVVEGKVRYQDFVAGTSEYLEEEGEETT